MDNLGDGLDDLEASEVQRVCHSVDRLKSIAQDLAMILVAEIRKAKLENDFRVVSYNVPKRNELHPFRVSLEEISLGEEDGEGDRTACPLKYKPIASIYAVEGREGCQQEFYLEDVSIDPEVLRRAVDKHGADCDFQFTYSADGGHIL